MIFHQQILLSQGPKSKGEHISVNIDTNNSVSGNYHIRSMPGYWPSRQPAWRQQQFINVFMSGHLTKYLLAIIFLSYGSKCNLICP